MEVFIDDEAKLTLHGLQQHYVKIKENEKNRKLFDLLDALEFNQVTYLSPTRKLPDNITAVECYHSVKNVTYTCKLQNEILKEAKNLEK